MDCAGVKFFLIIYTSGEYNNAIYDIIVVLLIYIIIVIITYYYCNTTSGLRQVFLSFTSILCAAERILLCTTTQKR